MISTQSFSSLTTNHSSLTTNHSSIVRLVFLVGVISILFRGLLLRRYPFDGLYGQDAYFYLTATQDLTRIWTDPAKLWRYITVWGTPPVSVWPLGYHLQMALSSLITGLNASAGQVVSFITGSLKTIAGVPFTLLRTIRLTSLTRSGVARDDPPNLRTLMPRT